MKNQIQIFSVVMLAMLFAPGAQAVQCDRTITANVVVLDNPTVFNRLGAQNPNWITYALRRDVIDVRTGTPEGAANADGLVGILEPGFVALRPDKRPRPLVVRSAAGDCLTVNFQNLLAPVHNPNNFIDNPLSVTDNVLINNDQVFDRCASFHAQGVELVGGMDSDGSFVGKNNPGVDVNVCGPNAVKGGLVGPGGEITYTLYTPHEGTFTVNSYGATIGSEANGGNLGMGMFAQLNVQPKRANMYRSQVTEEELRLATTGFVEGDCTFDLNGDPIGVHGVDCNPGGQPIIDYEALYPNDCAGGPAAPVGGGDGVWCREGKAGLPILNMLAAGDELVHSDINAIIVGTGSNGKFLSDTYPLESVGKKIPNLPNRLEPFREFSSIYHDEQANTQVFPLWYNDPVLGYTLAGVKDAFMINYGSGGIGSEIIANRLHTGPMHDCTDCAYEEFFLASQTVGDPAMLVNFPANTGIEACDPSNILDAACWREFDDGAGGIIGANPPIPGNYALYQEDPANVHHSYTGDFIKIRNIHAGAFEQHIFHLHNHQWLFNPNDDNSNYIDAQEIMPGSGHTYELVNGGGGNRNKTTGDAIFHCHFYPHFAQGMWYHIRLHDVMEVGTVLNVSNVAPANAQNPPLFDPLDPQANFHAAAFDLRSGRPAVGARALPDGELLDGSPIPAVVPLPGKGMPQMPARVTVAAVDRGDYGVVAGRTGPNGLGQGADSSQAVVTRFGPGGVAGPDGALGTADDVSPGFPFWLAGNECGPNADPANAVCDGIVGQRMPTPVLDMLTEAGADAISARTCTAGNPNRIGDACTVDSDCGNPNQDPVCAADDPLFETVTAAQAGGWDGGLPRHALLGYTAGGLSLDTNSRLDFSKIVEMAQPVYYPETGTDLELVSMAYQAVRNRPSAANILGDPLNTAPGAYVLSGAPPVPGGPFNDPCIDDAGNVLNTDVLGAYWDGNLNGGLTTRGRSTYSADNPRTYKVANVQIDAVFNKVGYHYPQERIISLWDDVAPTIAKQRPPEPLVMRFATFDCGKILHTNLVPAEFELDDFQVRTPTDIIGQHIHLPKWDLTTNDGAANGWNYEDGALAPGIVQERIHAINKFNELAGTLVPTGTLPGQFGPLDLTDLAPVPTIETGDAGSQVAPGTTHLTALPHPFFEAGLGNEYLGARTVIQRLFEDPITNVAGTDRGLGMTFSHDHYGPSTFQQIGLYSTIITEPAGSTWLHNESGEELASNVGRLSEDGGPTSWQAVILPPDEAPLGSTVGSEDLPDHREFYFEMSDFQHAYEAGVYVGADLNGRPLERVEMDRPCLNGIFDATCAEVPAGDNRATSWQFTVNPPLKLKSVPFPDIVTAEGACPGPLGNADPNIPRPCAEAINISHSSMFVVNYRNEPIGLRVFDPNKIGPDGKPGTQAGGLNQAGVDVPLEAGDLAFAFQSRRDRAIDDLNTSFGTTPYPNGQDIPYCQGNNGDGINCDRNQGDPYTPIMRAYENDQVKIKIQVGATEEQHQTTIHGMKWLSNGSGFGRAGNSGWRNFQSHGISEQFSLQVPVNPDPRQRGNTVDYLYATDASRDGIWLGSWGILRSYGQLRQDLVELPDNPQQGPRNVVNANEFTGVCPNTATVRLYDVTAVLANDVLPNALNVNIPDNAPLAPRALGVFANDNEGGLLTTDEDGGGTLVYNRRTTNVPQVTVPGEGGEPPVTLLGGDGPLNDPTAMMYVRTEDLVVAEVDVNGVPTNPQCSLDPLVNPNAVDSNLDGIPDTVVDPATGAQATSALQLPRCPVVLADNAPVEPLVLRANAGDCIDTVLRNRLPFTAQNILTPVDTTGDGIPDVDVVTGVTFTPEPAPDLAGWQDMMWVVNRDLFNPVRPPQMHFFNNNLIRPSSHVGLHAQLVEYDASRHDGLVVGGNAAGGLLAPPGGTMTSRWYAGDLSQVPAPGRGNQRNFEIVATPIEFGGTNLLSADRIKQPQKGLFGALVIEPADATYPDTLAELTTADERVPDGQADEATTPLKTRLTRAQATITSTPGEAGSGGTYREALAIGHKITNLRWADGSAISNINQGELGREGAEDSGHAGFNYGMEPSWFRFRLPPDVPFGAGGAPLNQTYGSIDNAHAMYANQLVTNATHGNFIPAIPGVSAAGDPQTPVFRTPRNTATRMHVLNGASADRDGTFMLHGHVWQRDPFVCTGASQDDTLGDPNLPPEVLLPGRCDPLTLVPSLALGDNPQAKYLGGEEGMGHVFGHWPILFDAGGTDGIAGDYLYRDFAPNGNRNGQFGILRVE